MAQGKSKQQQRKGERRFSQEQYDMLLRCSEKKDISEWNHWRQNNPEEEILLEGADLARTDLAGADLRRAHLAAAIFRGTNLAGARLTEAVLRRARLRGANAGGAVLANADLEGALLIQANLRRADLWRAKLRGANLREADLREANLMRADLEGASLRRTNLEGADAGGARLSRARLHKANLRGTHLGGAWLHGAVCRLCVVDGTTLLWECKADLHTDFRGVGLNSARIEPALKEILEYNIRRMNWKDWYKQHGALKWLVRPFWWMSDYGLSTARIIAVFFGLAILFAAIYWIWGLVAPPGIVQNLLVDRNGIVVPSALVPFRALYFSVVTMTTLGFGDMHAYAASFWGHLLLMVQVLLGYVLLAALVTRFAILFTAGGPAGRFSKPDKKPNPGDRGESK